MARPTLGDGKSERLHMFISEAELRAIDDWAFANRVRGRSEAVRQLCRIGLGKQERVRDVVTERVIETRTAVPEHVDALNKVARTLPRYTDAMASLLARVHKALEAKADEAA